MSIEVDALAEKISELANNKTLLKELKENVPLAAVAFDPELLAERYDSAYNKCLSQ